MLARLHKWLVVLTLVVLIGGHWAILQSAAWVSMAVKFSKTESVSVALEKTFNGKNPCRVCKLVKAGKEAEKKQDLVKLESKFEFLTEAATCWLFPPQPIRHFSAASEFSEPLGISPPVPPPRFA